MDLVPQSGL